MPRRKFVETDADADPPAKKPTKTAKASSATNAPTKTAKASSATNAPPKSAKVSGAPNAPPNAPDSATRECPIKFVCVPRPPWDFRLEHKGESDSDDEDDGASSSLQKKWTETLKEAKKIWLKPAAEFPDHTWKLSLKARKLNKKYDLQVQKRDQDSFGMYIYNDFTGYGLQEVIENQLSAFNKEFTSRKPSPFVLWYMMESLAWWFNSTDLMQWNMIDDGMRVYETLQIVGLAILSTLNILEQGDLLNNDSVIPNIPLILSLFLGFPGDFGDAMSLGDEDQDWPNAITAYAAKHDTNIKGKYGVTGENYPADELSAKKIALVEKAASVDKWDFKRRYKKFSATYGNGGVEFDITKMSKAERKAKAFDKKDPLVGMPPVPSEDQPTDDDEPFLIDSKESTETED